MVFLENDSLELECQIFGSPEPEVEWDKDGVPLQTSDEVSIENRSGKALLSIKRAKPSDAGLYTCTALNSAGKSQSSCKVIIETENEESTQPAQSQGASEEVLPKMKIVQGLKNQTVKEGSSATLEAIFSSERPPQVR